MIDLGEVDSVATVVAVDAIAEVVDIVHTMIEEETENIETITIGETIPDIMETEAVIIETTTITETITLGQNETYDTRKTRSPPG